MKVSDFIKFIEDKNVNKDDNIKFIEDKNIIKMILYKIHWI